VRLIATQALHWTAVVFAMYLVFVADVRQMMSEIASSLMVLIVLALETSTLPPGVFAWLEVLSLGVPVIAWLLTFVLFAVIVVFFVLYHRRAAKEVSF
jgi:hypothetical protein